MTASPGSYTYENDILGNRTWRNHYASTGGQKYEWDELNRLTKFMSTTSGARYKYRADGMRVQKVEGFNLSWQWNDKEHTSGYYDEFTATNLPTTRYYYDGQMAVEDDYTAPSTYTIRKYGVGARGIDYLENWSSSTTIASKLFPLYDCHGNMIATLERSGSNSYTMANTRYFDAWGTPSNSGGPHQKYCANLGHVQDDESGLIYMRARFYEPTTGRFVSEDAKRDGANWYVYSKNDPVGYADISGQSAFEVFELELFAWFAICLADPTASVGLFQDGGWQLIIDTQSKLSEQSAFEWANAMGCSAYASGMPIASMKSLLLDMAEAWESRATATWAEQSLIGAFGPEQIEILSLLLDLRLPLGEGPE